MPLKLNSTSGGSVTLQEPTTASNRTLTLPDATGTVNTSGAVNEVPVGSASAPSIYPTGDTNTGIFFPAADTIAFTEGGAESARIDSSGNLLVGKTTQSDLTPGSTFYPGGQWDTGTTGTGSSTIVKFSRGTSGSMTSVGSISTTGSATAYNTSSDYRLKKDVSPMAGALARIAALRPVVYKWKLDDSDGEGFIAHELAEVFPQAVTGEKDAVDENDRPVYQGIDTSFLVATLVKAIQEQQAMIEELKAKVAALEAK